MCGIIGVVGEIKNAGEILYNGIKKLEYRGYDSVGMACLGKVLTVKKDVGSVDEVEKKHNLRSVEGRIGIAHSRWATCGEVSQVNAHPHLSKQGKIAIVHNGVIRNYEEIYRKLGIIPRSKTDSEVIAHYFEKKLESFSIRETVSYTHLRAHET